MATGHHGTKPVRGLTTPGEPDPPVGKSGENMFGRLSHPEPQQPPDAALIDLGRQGGPMDGGEETPSGDNPAIPAGFVFLGQFVDHDITLDQQSSFDSKNNPNATINTRSPYLELDSLYGSGRKKTPELYDQADSDKLRIGTQENSDDLPRDDANKALIGDFRNDENLFIAQLHAVFIRFHNKVVDHLRNQGVTNVFNRAQQMVRWHYQWMLVHDFLPRIVGQALVDDILSNGPRLFRLPGRKKPYMPVEFSVAAYRYGHSQVRSRFRMSSQLSDVLLFSPPLEGFRPVPASHVLDWRNFFELEQSHPPQASRRIDTKLAGVLFSLPFISQDEPIERRSLAVRNLLRGKSFRLPSGQTIARRSGSHALSDQELGLHGTALAGQAPLWFYILKEAEVLEGGGRLGAVGGRLVGEVLLELLKDDPASYFSDSNWTPSLPTQSPGTFTMADLVRFAIS
jgi:hypothetical protein